MLAILYFISRNLSLIFSNKSGYSSIKLFLEKIVAFSACKTQKLCQILRAAFRPGKTLKKLNKYSLCETFFRRSLLATYARDRTQDQQSSETETFPFRDHFEEERELGKSIKERQAGAGLPFLLHIDPRI